MSESVQVRGLTVRYEQLGPEGAPVVALCHSLGTSLALWDAQVNALARRHRVVRFDLRGHGETDLSTEQYSIADLGADVIALFDVLDIERAHFCGVSLGGFIGQWLGANAPDRIGKLVLSNTAARIGPASMWDERVATIRNDGMSSIASGAIGRWFTPSFVASEPAVVDRFRHMLIATPVDGYTHACIAIRDMDLTALASSITSPTLIVTGAHDCVTPPETAAWLAGNIRGAALLELEAAHLANVEAADEYTRAVLAFFSTPGE